LTKPDEQALKRAGEHEAQALAEIYDHYSAPIYRYLYRVLGDAAQAEDLTSEVFLKLLQVLHTSRAPGERLEGWLYGVAHNLAMDLFRRQKRKPELSLAEDLVAAGDQPSAIVERRQAAQQLRAGLARLTFDQQRVVLLRFAEGFPAAEVARLMGKSEGAVKILQHRAVNRLRKLMDG
jgi:RNA polymerase sigma-70 factor (ECF subfamily)